MSNLRFQFLFSFLIFLSGLLLLNQQISAQSLGDPLVKITFGSGTAERAGALAADSGSTTYTYSGSGQIGENVYTITNVINTTVHGGFVTSTDHTGNTGGYMMVVNGNLTAGTVFTRTVNGLCGNTQYQFGVWIKNVLQTGGILPNMVFHIYAADGTTELGSGISTGDVPTGNVWHNYTANFSLPAGTQTVVIKLVSNASGQQGNDFAVDDISFSPYGSTVSAVFNSSTATTETTCAGSNQTYTINATSTLASGFVQKLQLNVNGIWADLTAGSTATSFNITSPATAGTYQYRLVSAITDNISSPACVVSSNYLTLTVTPTPTAAFTVPDPTCLGSASVFTDASVSNGTTIASWFWDFGDGQTSTLQNPTHTYATANGYMVKLTVSGTTGCLPSTTAKTIIISPLPGAAFSNTSPNCLGNAITFTDQSTTVPGISLTNWLWDYGDGITETKTSSAAFQHTYSAAGTYVVKLTVTNSNGCTAVATHTITISAIPIADFTTPDVCLADASATFINASTIPAADATGATYLWNFGDSNATAVNPNTSTLKNPSHKYTAAADYQVTLAVTSGSGCSSTVAKSFTVNGSVPIASFSIVNPGQLCSNLPVSFTNLSTVDFGSITKIDWYYDLANNPTSVVTDNDPMYGKVYTHTYTSFHTPAIKTYQVRLMAYSGGTCVAVLDKTITLLAVADLSFDKPADICVNGGTVQFKATENAGLPGSGSFSGSGVSSSGLFDPAISGPGTFAISYVYNPTNGCADTISQNVTVNSIEAITVGPDITVLSGGNARLPATATGNGLTYSWSPITYLSDPTVLNPTVTPLQDIVYTLTVTNSSGCATTGMVKVGVLQGPVIPNTFTPNGDGINDLWNIKYLDTYTDCTVIVFNRYGVQVFSSVGYGIPWDGNYNGKQIPVGVYYYVINPKHGRSLMSGFVAVVR